MLKRLLVAATAVALIAAPVASAYAQATTTEKAKTTAKPKTEKAQTEKVAKPLTPQQQKMKDCAAKWNEEKTVKKVSGRAAHNKFMSGCLKGTA
jgi:ABC-type glycerol-3-phosphate transport system substrate-binding protein